MSIKQKRVTQRIKKGERRRLSFSFSHIQLRLLSATYSAMVINISVAFNRIPVQGPPDE
jgi:hypothetical protein